MIHPAVTVMEQSMRKHREQKATERQALAQRIALALKTSIFLPSVPIDDPSVLCGLDVVQSEVDQAKSDRTLIRSRFEERNDDLDLDEALRLSVVEWLLTVLPGGES